MKHILHALIFAILAFAGAARAQPAEFRPTYERGMAHFKAKEFARARTEFLAAYAMHQDPTVVFAVAQTYRFEGNFKEAIDWYRKFIADSQVAQDLRTEAQTYLSESEDKLRALEEERRKAAATGPVETNGEPAKMPPAGSTPVPVEQRPRSAAEAPVRTRRIPLGSKIAAGVAGAGLIASIVATKLGLDVESEFQAKGRTATVTDAARVDRYQNLINVSWGVTAAAAATSVVLYFVAPSYTTERRHLAIAPSDGGWSAMFTRRF